MLRWISVAILSIFLLENLLHVIEMGFAYFTEEPFHVFDMVVVAVALAFEVQGGNASTAFLVFGRCWRFLQFGHGV